MSSTSSQVPSSLTLQLVTVSIIVLQRQLAHFQVTSRNSWNNVYDYVVVGAGASGAVVAERLSEDSNTMVLLLEAGGPESIVTDMPALAFTLFGSEFDWNYYTTPQQEAGLAFVQHRVRQPRGRVIGGSSTTNTNIYNRGNRRDFDNWAFNLGLDGWSFDDVLPYFIRSENNTDEDIVRENSGYHGTEGPMVVSSAANPDPVILAYRDVANANGYPTVDLNGETQLGTAIVQQNIDLMGVRQSTGVSYLQPNRNRRNLHIVSRALVTRILFSSNNRATGVTFRRDGRNYTVSARNEIILSAGAINTPQLLMLSGIGPRDHLRQFRIPVISDLPVGDNLQDHYFFSLDFFVYNQSDVTSSVELSLENEYLYFKLGTGPLAHNPFGLTYRSTSINDDPQWPDTGIITHVSPINNNLTRIVSQYGENVREWRDYWRPYVGETRHMIVNTLMYRARSLGTVRLASSSPFDYPLIDPRYYSNPYDLDAVVETAKETLRLALTPQFSRHARIFQTPIPGCQPCSGRNDTRFLCDSYLRCAAQRVTQTSYHPSCTCKMGHVDSDQTVVDTRLRVKGVSCLRVVDASIMPVLVNGNPNAVSMLIGEYAADMIREDANSIKKMA